MRYAGYEEYEEGLGYAVFPRAPLGSMRCAGSGEASGISRIMPFVTYYEH